MPSPIGHALAGVAAGWAVAGRAGPGRPLLVQSSILAALAMAPDLDLLAGPHRAATHSIGAAVLAGVVMAALQAPIAASRRRILAAAAFSWLTHPLLDVISADTSVPIGVMLWWPFGVDYVHAGLEVFRPVWRRWWLPGWTSHTLQTLAQELAILVPVLAATLWAVGRAARRRAGPADPQ